MKYKRIIFWQEHPSPHQAPWIRALAEIILDGRVIGVFRRDLVTDRLSLGWRQPDYGRAQVLIAPKPETVDRLVGNESERTVHVFSGMVHNPAISAIFKQALTSGALVGILSEGRDWRGWKGILRKVHAIFNERSYRNSVDFVLAIGRVGINWFDLCGYQPAKLFPFGYVVENIPAAAVPDASETSLVLTAIGRLIPLKRLDLLLNALAECPFQNWVLNLIGDGVLRSSLESQAEDLGLQSRIRFRGVLANEEVIRELQLTDLLIFTSNADGWGAVVNEALMCGVPVVCSDYCGAADLIKPGFNGDLFRCDSLGSLVQVLSTWMAKGRLKRQTRSEITAWSHCIQGDAVAEYFLEILAGLGAEKPLPRPRAPWEIR